MPTPKKKKRHQRAGHARGDHRAVAPDRGHQGRHDGWRHRSAKKSGEGVDRKCAAHPRFVHVRREYRVIGRMINAVGQSQERGAYEQRGIAQMYAECDQRSAAEAKAHQQNLPCTEMVGEITNRGLGQAGTHRRNRQCKAEFDIADIEFLFQEGKQHRQHENMEMAHPMGRRYRAQRAELFVFDGLLRCGQNIGHFGRFLDFARENIGPSGYLSMNMVAWQLSKRCQQPFISRPCSRKRRYREQARVLHHLT
jgi:hypothetical protein